MSLTAFLGWLLSLIGSFALGSYVRAYSAKKGENRAIHEDLNKLVEQMKATTEATKAIEARIDDQAWNRQRQWELTRDAAIKLMKAHSRIEDAGDEVIRTHTLSRDIFASSPGPLEASAALEGWRTARRAMIDVLGFVSFACFTRETSSSIATCAYLIRGFQFESDRDMAHAISRKAEELVNAFNALKRALHRELGLQEKEGLFGLITPLSSESSEAQGPAASGR